MKLGPGNVEIDIDGALGEIGALLESTSADATSWRILQEQLCALGYGKLSPDQIVSRVRAALVREHPDGLGKQWKRGN